MPKVVDQAPSPKSHIKTLTRIGYTLNSAVADIVDNCIAANAKNIDIYSPPGLEDPFISILDDGWGMDQDELVENMRIGCKDPEEERQKGDLGRFGSGMKTASFSQARQLTVVSKKKGHSIAAARWNLDKIEVSDSWCLEVFEPDEISEISELSREFPEECGTQIIWNGLTFLDKGSHADSHDAELAHHLAELKDYISLHFHRFMSGQEKRFFRLNNTPLEPIDPFMTHESGYQEGPSEKMRCKGGYIEIKTHVLPLIKDMNPERLEQLGGASGIAQKQGLYLYRERRLINPGGWMGLSANSQLGALARVQVDIPSALDNDWSTDVKKASLQMPARVKRGLKRFLADPVKRSRKAYTYQGKKEAANKFWKICEDENTKIISYQVDTDNPLLESLTKKCDKESRKVLVEYLKQLAINLPINHIYEKMSDRPQDVSQDEVDIAALERLLDLVFEI